MKKCWTSWMIPFLGLVLLVLAATSGCATYQPEEKPGDPVLLEQTAHSFHSNLRWGRFEDAAELVHQSYRATFEGEYEERGDDYDIVEMNVRRVEIVEDGFAAVIEVEQDWYQLPSTVVQSERFMERWVWEDDRWWMRERLLRDVYRERDRTFDSEKTSEEGGELEASHDGES